MQKISNFIFLSHTIFTLFTSFLKTTLSSLREKLSAFKDSFFSKFEVNFLCSNENNIEPKAKNVVENITNLNIFLMTKFRSDIF